MKRKNILLFLSLAVLLCLLSLASLMFGSVALKPSDILAALTGSQADSVTYILIRSLRIPRLFGGLFAGIGLASAGVILQTVMNNSLAGPNTIGVNSGAGFAVMLSLLLFPANIGMQSAAAFLGAFVTAILIFALAYLGDSSRTTIVLAGVTVSGFLSAGINLIKLTHSDITVDLTTFLIGSLNGLTAGKILLPCILIGAALVISLCFTVKMNLLLLGEDIARSLGLSVAATRFLLLLLASVLAGSVVCYAGLLGFVGLIVPHICRKLFGNDIRLLLPASALTGACFVLACDLLGRVITAPYELPAGILMSFLGGPFFLYLLLRKKGGRRINA